MNIINVTFEIAIITYQMFPRSALPNHSFTPFLTRKAHFRLTRSVHSRAGDMLFNQRPAQRKVRIGFRHCPDGVKVIGK